MDFKKVIGLAAAGLLLASPIARAKAPKHEKVYEKVLKQWTREDKVYVWDNFEARLVWHATYLSPEYRAARRERLAGLYEWTNEELVKKIREDAEEDSAGDEFFLSIYAGSSEWPEVGKDDGKWRIVLEQDGRAPVEAIKLERLPLTQAERELYPFLDKWSIAYLVRFPKMIRSGAPFRIRMTGIPARSELLWK